MRNACIISACIWRARIAAIDSHCADCTHTHHANELLSRPSTISGNNKINGSEQRRSNFRPESRWRSNAQVDSKLVGDLVHDVSAGENVIDGTIESTRNDFQVTESAHTKRPLRHSRHNLACTANLLQSSISWICYSLDAVERSGLR